MYITSTSEAYSIFNDKYQVTLKGLLLFEIKSLYGRKFLNYKPKLKQDDKNLLHLGCGKNKFDNWVNADFFSLSIPVIKNIKNKIPDWMLDLRFPLNCDANVWDGVFTEHTLEHLYPYQSIKLLEELNRTMKPGAWLRVTVPDLKKYISYYCGQELHEEFKRWGTGCEAIRTLAQDYFHVSLWDSGLLSKCLNKSGFINIQEVSFMKGNDISLLKDKEERSWETLYMEAQKRI
ncbi:MAG: hypothetical protein V7K76_18485 [Nostoc sp.]|uniref:class I SAM-dependent methyltransferase n=1 Tax=Nostoc sp. TaxID=1180 RepID=UPI002FFAD6E0